MLTMLIMKVTKHFYYPKMFFCVCIMVCMYVNVCMQWVGLDGVRKTLVIKKLKHYVILCVFFIKYHLDSEQLLPRDD